MKQVARDEGFQSMFLEVLGGHHEAVSRESDLEIRVKEDNMAEKVKKERINLQTWKDLQQNELNCT